ncbi:uncharacterized protein METZ01_LOCUS366770, partial [marine metagenome]
VPYSVYLIECSDGSLYTGISTDVSRRIAEHEVTQKGAKYLRGRGPLKLVFEREVGNRSLASRVESKIKRLPRRDKGDITKLAALVDIYVSELI